MWRLKGNAVTDSIIADHTLVFEFHQRTTARTGPPPKNIDFNNRVIGGSRSPLGSAMLGVNRIGLGGVRGLFLSQGVRISNRLEQRRQKGQANACLDSHSGQIMGGPATINGIRNHAGKSGRAPSCSNNGEYLCGLGDQASDSKA